MTNHEIDTKIVNILGLNSVMDIMDVQIKSRVIMVTLEDGTKKMVTKNAVFPATGVVTNVEQDAKDDRFVTFHIWLNNAPSGQDRVKFRQLRNSCTFGSRVIIENNKVRKVV